MEVNQEVLVRCFISAVVTTQSGTMYRVIPYSRKEANIPFDMEVHPDDVETCRHCGYKGELMCDNCINEMAKNIGGLNEDD